MGGKKEGSYYPWDYDNEFACSISEFLRISCQNVNLVMEGGAVLCDGDGTLFTTCSVLLNRNRNPFRSRTYIEGILKETLHVNKIVWIPQGLALDETNGHVDNLLSIIKPHEICLAWTDDANDINYKRVRNAYDAIMSVYDCIVHKIPLPEKQYRTKSEAESLVINPDSIIRREGDLLPASYLNLCFVNGGVIIPAFGCKEDSIVMELFSKIISGRKIEQLYSREPLLGGGGIHCLLHEIPEI